MNKEKVLILTNFFEPEYAYQEVQIADELHKQGYEVTVVASDKSQFDSKKHVDSNNKPYTVEYLKKYLRLSTTILFCSNSKRIANKFTPDYVILIHPNMGLPHHIGKHFVGKAKLISLYGDTVFLEDMDLKKRLMLKLFKKRWITHYLDKSAVFANTNRTVKILTEINNGEIDNINMLGIGYNSTKYYYDEPIRKKERERLGVEKNVVLVTATRIVSNKKIIEHIAPILEAMFENEKLIYIIAGFDESDYSKQVKEFIQKHPNGNRVITFDMLNQRQLLSVYNAADYGYWYRAAISIQQAMGTGVYVFLPDQDWLDHLVDSGINGEYINNVGIKNLLKDLSINQNKKYISEFNQSKFSYTMLVNEYLQNAFLYNEKK